MVTNFPAFHAQKNCLENIELFLSYKSLKGWPMKGNTKKLLIDAIRPYYHACPWSLVNDFIAPNQVTSERVSFEIVTKKFWAVKM